MEGYKNVTMAWYVSQSNEQTFLAKYDSCCGNHFFQDNHIWRFTLPSPMGSKWSTPMRSRWRTFQSSSNLIFLMIVKRVLHMDVSLNGGTPKTPQNDHF